MEVWGKHSVLATGGWPSWVGCDGGKAPHLGEEMQSSRRAYNMFTNDSSEHRKGEERRMQGTWNRWDPQDSNLPPLSTPQPQRAGNHQMAGSCTALGPRPGVCDSVSLT